jgi:hypothetical protein
MANVHGAGDPAMVAAGHHPIKQGQMPPPVRHHHQSGGSLLCADACLGLLHFCDASLLQMR